MPIKIETQPKGWFGNWTDEERKFWDRGEDDPQALLAVRWKDVVVTVDVEIYEDKDGPYEVYLCSLFRNEEIEDKAPFKIEKETYRFDLSSQMMGWLTAHIRKLECVALTEEMGEENAVRKIQTEELIPNEYRSVKSALASYVDDLGYKGEQRLKVSHERDYTGDTCAFCGAMQFLNSEGQKVCGNIHD